MIEGGKKNMSMAARCDAHQFDRVMNIGERADRHGS